MILQIILAILSCISIWLLAGKNSYSKWGFVIGLLNQPLWLYSFYINGQWGMFVVAIWFTINYIRAILNNFTMKYKLGVWYETKI